jgi:ADP-heptose:LPS heptosyltransferase
MEKKKIMVFRFSAMGDVAMAVPVIKAVVEQNENVEIQMVSRPFFAPFFQSIPKVKYVPANFNKDYKGLKGLFKLFRFLNKENPDYIADLHDVLRTKFLRLLFKISGKKIHYIDKGRKEKKALTREKNKIFKPLKTTHERYADVFRKLGMEVDLSKVATLSPPSLSSQVSLFLQTFEGSKIIGIAPFAAHKGKQYPLEKIKKLIKILLKEKNISIILFGGGKQEKMMLDELEKLDRNRIVNITGIFSLEEELQIISRLDKMLSMDSGNGHMAAMFGVPVVSIWGVTHPYAGFVPFRQQEENQFFPDIKKHSLLPTSVYGNKIYPGFEKIWDDISEEKIAQKLLEY